MAPISNTALVKLENRSIATSRHLRVPLQRRSHLRASYTRRLLRPVQKYHRVTASATTCAHSPRTARVTMGGYTPSIPTARTAPTATIARSDQRRSARIHATTRMTALVMTVATHSPAAWSARHSGTSVHMGAIATIAAQDRSLAARRHTAATRAYGQLTARATTAAQGPSLICASSAPIVPIAQTVRTALGLVTA